MAASPVHELIEAHTLRIQRAMVLSEQLKDAVKRWPPDSITPARFADLQQVVLEVQDAYSSHMAALSGAFEQLRQWARRLPHDNGSDSAVECPDLEQAALA